MNKKPLSILITGAASGLGKALSIEAARAGYKLFLIDISASLSEVAEALGAEFLVIDIAQPEAVDKVIAWTGEIDVLVNNAGIARKSNFENLTKENLELSMSVNIVAPVTFCHGYLNQFLLRGTGTIVNICSSAAYFPTPMLGTYGASKSFLLAFTESLITEYRPCKGIHILGICPSGINTNFQRSAGVKNENPNSLLDPAILSKKILQQIKLEKSTIKHFGLSTLIFILLRSFMPRQLYLNIIGRIFLEKR